MSLLPRSRTARRRLMMLGVAAPVLILAVGVTLLAMRSSISFFYTPSQAAAKRSVTPVRFRGELPDLFREGQGVVAIGAYRQGRVFVADKILAKHDEKYMPPELTAALKKQGEWRGDG